MWRSLCVSSLSALLLLAGCNGSKEKAQDVAESAENMVKEPSLTGDFTGSCVDSDLLDLSERLALDFTGNQIEQKRQLYKAADCKEVSVEVRYEGEFKIQNQKNAPWKAMDVHFEKVFVEPKNSTGADVLNAVNFCGRNDYASGEEYELTANTGQTLCPLSRVPSSYFGAYKMEGGDLILSTNSPLSFSQKPSERSSGFDKDYRLKD